MLAYCVGSVLKVEMRTSLRVFTTSKTEVCGLARAVYLYMWNTTVELIHMTTLLIELVASFVNISNLLKL